MKNTVNTVSTVGDSMWVGKTKSGLNLSFGCSPGAPPLLDLKIVDLEIIDLKIVGLKLFDFKSP